MLRESQDSQSSVLFVGKDDLELLMLLSLPPECWDYSYMLPCLVYGVLGIKPRALCVLGKPSAIEPHPKPPPYVFPESYASESGKSIFLVLESQWWAKGVDSSSESCRSRSSQCVQSLCCVMSHHLRIEVNVLKKLEVVDWVGYLASKYTWKRQNDLWTVSCRSSHHISVPTRSSERTGQRAREYRG